MFIIFIEIIVYGYIIKYLKEGVKQTQIMLERVVYAVIAALASIVLIGSVVVPIVRNRQEFKEFQEEYKEVVVLGFKLDGNSSAAEINEYNFRVLEINLRIESEKRESKKPILDFYANDYIADMDKLKYFSTTPKIPDGPILL